MKVRAKGKGRLGAVLELSGERAFFHLLKAKGQHAVAQSTTNELIRHKQRGAASRTIVVYCTNMYSNHEN